MVLILRRPMLVAALACAACRDATPPPPAVPDPPEPPVAIDPAPKEAPPPEPRVVLVTIDGVRWQDVFLGADPAFAGERAIQPYADPRALVPRLHELSANGVAFGGDEEGCGVVRARATGNVSLPGYLEILGGRPTSCRSNACGRTTAPSFLDDAAEIGIGPVASLSSWEPIQRAATRGGTSVLVSAGARAWPVEPTSRNLAALAESGARARPYPAPSGAYRPDSLTTAIALEYVRADAPRVLHVGLGDTDEWAHRGEYVSYLKALHDADAFVGDLVDALAERGGLDATTILVTTDHGRGRDFRSHGPKLPESQRAFLFAFGRGVAKHGSRCASRDVELPDVASTIRALLDLPLGQDERPIEDITAIPD